MIMMPPINPAAKLAEANGSRPRDFRRDVRGGRSVGGCKPTSSCPAWTRAATTITAAPGTLPRPCHPIGSASCREREWQYGYISCGAVDLKTKSKHKQKKPQT